MPEQKKGIKVIGAGCGRTATASLKSALEKLGFDPCYHMYECLKNQSHFDKWSKVFDGNFTPEEWEDLLGGYGAALDNPASMAYEDIMKVYPDAKVILTTRDPTKWAKSVQETIWCPYSRSMSWVLFPYFASFQIMMIKLRRRFFNDFTGGVWSGALHDPKKLAGAFEEWNQRVIDTVPKEKLLVFEVQDGWEPLCKFLEVPVPNEPFPKTNEAGEFKADMMNRWYKYLALDTAIVAGIAALAYGAYAAATSS